MATIKFWCRLARKNIKYIVNDLKDRLHCIKCKYKRSCSRKNFPTDDKYFNSLEIKNGFFIFSEPAYCSNPRKPETEH